MTAVLVAVCLICDKTTVQQPGGGMAHATRADDEACERLSAEGRPADDAED